MQRASQEVFSSRDVDVRYSETGSDTCFVTFTSLGKNHPHGFGERLFEPRKMSAVYFISKWDHWYQPASVQDAVAVVQKLLAERGSRRIVTYGASMGGFGAAAFTRALRADVAILIAPQFSIDPAKAPHEKRWAREAKAVDLAFDDMQSQIRPETRTYILLDPYSPDRAHATLFARSPNAERIHVPFGGHLPARVLQRCGLLGDLTLQLASGTFDAPAFYRALHGARRSSHDWWATLSEHAQRRRPGAPERPRRLSFALDALQEAIRLAPAEIVQMVHAVYIMMRLERFAEAAAMAEQAVALTPDHPAPWRALSTARRRLGEGEASVAAARRAVALRANDGDLQRLLVEALLSDKQAQEAIPEAERAVGLDPRYPQNHILLATALKQCGRYGEAAEAMAEAVGLNSGQAAWMAELDRLRALASTMADAGS